MADYYPLIARAVAGLEKSTGDGRRTLYERARGALVQQLRGVSPALSESDITRERLALEEAIRKVEAEAVRKARSEGRVEGPPKVRAPDASRWEKAGRMNGPAAPPAGETAELPPRKPMPVPPRPEEFLRTAVAPRYENSREPPALSSERSRPPLQAKGPGSPPSPDETPCADPTFDRPAGDDSPEPVPPQTRPNRSRANGERRSFFDTGFKDAGFKDTGSKDNGPREARAFAPDMDEGAEPPALGKLGRGPIVPGQERDEAAAPEQGEMPAADPATPGAGPFDFPPQVMLESPRAADDAAPPRRPPPMPIDDDLVVTRPPRSYRGLVKGGIALIVLCCLAGVGVWQWPNVSALYSSLRQPAPEQKTDALPASSTARVKIPDRIEPGGQPSQPQTGVAVAPAGGVPAAVAQRVILYEEDPSSSPPGGKSFVGSVIWRTERVSPGPGKPAELAVRADAEIPERKMSVIWSLRRDTEPGLSTSHTIEVMFKLPPDFPAGGISNVPGVMMKQGEQAYGAPLAANSVKVTNAYFIIGLHALPATTKDHNIQMMKERSWLDIPIVYANGRRAILVLEKGNPGEKAFAEAFAAWRQ